MPQVEVKFDIDANGILSVTATDKGTQKKQDIKITGASTLNSDEVDRMVQEAEKYSAEDKTKRDAIETKNQVCRSQGVHGMSCIIFSVLDQSIWPWLYHTCVLCMHVAPMWYQCYCSLYFLL